MSSLSLEHFIAPYCRRDRRDISLSRITSTPVTLESNTNLRALLTPTFNRKKTEKSLYGKRLLNEILPQSNRKKYQPRTKYGNAPSKKRTSSADKPTKGTNCSAHLEKIVELNNVKRVIKLYEKSCDIKRHQPNNKFITHFLFPVNSHISKDFSMNMDDYKEKANKLQRRRRKPMNIPPLPFTKGKGIPNRI